MSKRFSIIVASLALLLLPILTVGAETFPTIKLNLDYPSFGGFNLGTNQDLVSIIGWLYYAIVTISGLAAFVMLVWGGIQWLTSSGNPGQIKDAQSRMSDALLGLGLVLGSYLILTIINPGLTTLEQPKLDAVTATGNCPAPIPKGDLCSVETIKKELGDLGYPNVSEQILATASSICQIESGGRSTDVNISCSYDIPDKRGKGTGDYSVGLFQYNLYVPSLSDPSARCPGALGLRSPDEPWNSMTNTLYCSIKNQSILNECVATYQIVRNNIKIMWDLSGGGVNWCPWKNSAARCGIGCP